MPVIYPYEEIKLGDASHSGHVVYQKAIYDKKRIILKLNKSANSELSRFEVAFTGLAQRFLKPGLTSEQALVANKDGELVGLASQHLFYEVAASEGLEKTFYVLNKEDTLLGFNAKTVSAAEDIPINFFDQFPSDFFARLCDSEKKGELSLDMESLASVLTTSYTLEEDDLHKGNLGFYVVQKDGKPHVVFLKIDHDLMMSDSIMSYFSSRLVNLRHGEHAFEVTARDLRHFPRLFDSDNHYWPTTKRYLYKPTDSKVYAGSQEIDAFIKIGLRKDFQQAKWRNFYKHILMPSELIEQSLTASFDKANPDHSAQIAMIAHAVIARQARLRAVLFSMPEFRVFVKKMGAAEHKAMVNEIFHNVDESFRNAHQEQVVQHITTHRQLCKNGVFVKGDTPLHAAIRLGDYRYHETWKSFSQFAEIPNSKGLRPLDIALEMAQAPSDKQAKDDVRCNALLIAKNLLMEGVNKTAHYRKTSRADRQKIEECEISSPHLDRSRVASSSRELIDAICDIGKDHRYSLKMKKSISIACIRAFIDSQRATPGFELILTEFKLALNGGGSVSPAPELQFIRQLRSRLWIVRLIRGLLGGTATQVTLDNMLDTELARFTQTASSCCFSFFSTGNKEQGQGNMDKKDRVEDISPGSGVLEI